MNQSFSGIVLLGGVVLIMAILFGVALFKSPKKAKSKLKAMPKLKVQNPNKGKAGSDNAKFNGFRSKKGEFADAPDTQLFTLKKLVTKQFPELTATVRQHHVVIKKGVKKVAMLTIDQAADLGRRRLGEVTVINFHKLPSVEELRIELSGV